MRGRWSLVVLAVMTAGVARAEEYMLLVPPQNEVALSRDSFTPSTEAPLSRWIQLGVFPSGTKCDAHRKKLLAQADADARQARDRAQAKWNAVPERLRKVLPEDWGPEDRKWTTYRDTEVTPLMEKSVHAVYARAALILAKCLAGSHVGISDRD